MFFVNLLPFNLVNTCAKRNHFLFHYNSFVSFYLTNDSLGDNRYFVLTARTKERVCKALKILKKVLWEISGLGHVGHALKIMSDTYKTLLSGYFRLFLNQTLSIVIKAGIYQIRELFCSWKFSQYLNEKKWNRRFVFS